MEDVAVVSTFAEAEQSSASRIADLLSKLIFGALLALIVIAALPYGTAQPWWKALFVCGVFSICIVALIEHALNDSAKSKGMFLVVPLICLSIFAFLQTLPLRRATPIEGLTSSPSFTAISADPYQTRFFALQLLALATVLALLYRYAATDSRIRWLVYVTLSVATLSAIFGLVRQTTQHGTGFILPFLEPDQGYGQFINRNHFAYLMEMAFGLGLGIALAGGVKRDRVLLNVALLLPIWMALVLSNSRGGILAMLTQVILAALILVRGSRLSHVDQNGLTRIQSSRLFKTVLVVALVFGLVGGTIWVGGDPLVKSFQSASNELNPETQSAYSGASRNEIWRATLKMFTANPILGVGLGGYWIGITAYHDASGMVTPQEAHNDYLELLSSGGVVGFALGLWFAITAFRKIKVALNTRSGFLRAVCVGAIMGIAGVAVHSLFDFGLHILVNALVLMVLLMMSTAEIRLESSSN
ncbi:MAG TPA: O-antigen ligase family protein [Pyrinomonadaceae bacterium]|nr:O-antigen ligase family protein [Pyrinomonadaceae bacterium]